jgi:hypothetical protein
MKDASESPEPEPLATPFELAQIAVALATMRGERRPDILGAIDLLKRAALEAAFETRPMAKPQIHYMTSSRMNPGPGEIIVTPESDPIAWEAHLKDIRSFPGSEKIKAPKAYPATLTTCLRCLKNGRSLTNQEKTKLKTCTADVRKNLSWMGDKLQGEYQFWVWAREMASAMPEFAKLYGKPSPRTRRSRQAGSKGQIEKPKRGPDGQFIPKKNGASKK